MLDRGLIIERLKALGADDESAARRADAIIAETRNAGLVAMKEPRGGGKTFAIERAAAEAELAGVTVYRGVRTDGAGVPVSVDAVFRFPFRLVLPWSHLISDRYHYAPAMRGGKPAMILTIPYRNAKRKAAQAARKAWGELTTYDEPLRLEAKVYFPNGTVRQDAHNFQKCAHDALTGIVYADDSQLYSVRWDRAGVDVDAPRAEITISPYTGTL